MLIISLGLSVTTPSAPGLVLVDGGQLLYHIVCSVSGTTGDLAGSFGTRLAHYPHVSKKIVLSDGYDREAPSAKNFDRTRRDQSKKSFFTIPRKRICSTTFYAVISFYTTYK